MPAHEESRPSPAVDTAVPMTRSVDKLRTVCGRQRGTTVAGRCCLGAFAAEVALGADLLYRRPLDRYNVQLDSAGLKGRGGAMAAEVSATDELI